MAELLFQRLLQKEDEKAQATVEHDELRYPLIFIYLLMCSLCFLIPIIDLFMYTIWLRWSTSERDKLKRDARVSNAPFALRSLHFGTTWTMDNYTGITEFLWKFASIGFKGIFVAIAWPFWLFPIVIGSVVYVVMSIILGLGTPFFNLIRKNEEYVQYDSLSESEDEYEEVEKKEGGGEDSDG